jgi:flagellar hook assembly protein FlgD
VIDIGDRTATDDVSTPRSLTLDVYPSPFNPVTTVALSLPRPSPVSIKIYDIRGRQVRTLFQGELFEGRHEFRWDAADDAGDPLASGVYVLRTQTEQETKTRKVALVR